MSERQRSYSRMVRAIREFLKDRFNLSEGKASERQTTEEIKQGVVFRGANLWILIFAIMVCSVGLNMNNTAVIIGAMLISPLMGPIMGVGLGAGTNDFQLILKSLKNFGIAVLISVVTSALYFWISPLNDAQSELLARIEPTLWDVLIASFGGLAGIVAGSRRDKSNAIPGVAIATALMPPLCTAGFALVTNRWDYFFGAMYLFFINSVFISLATYMIVRVLKFKTKEFLDPKREMRVKQYIAVFALITILPSSYTAFNIVREARFNQRAQQFISQEITFPQTTILDRQFSYDKDGGQITITLFGARVSPEDIINIQEKLPSYLLEECDLTIIQAHQGDEIDLETVQQLNQQLKTGIIEDLYTRNEELIKSKDDRIKILEAEIYRYESAVVPMADIAREVRAIDPNVSQISVVQSIVSRVDSLSTDTVMIAWVDFKNRPTAAERKMLQGWLKERTRADTLRLVVD